MTPEERALVDYANANDAMLSLLYDLDLMPEQTMNTKSWRKTLRIIDCWRAAIAEEREACAKFVEQMPCDAGCDNWLRLTDAIRRRT